MAYYLVSAVPRDDLLQELETRLAQRAFERLRPFGQALSSSLRAARRRPDGTAVWEEEDYCRPPLAEERAAVLDRYFTDLAVEPVERGAGWERIEHLSPLFPNLAAR
ncbi:MAG: hypothetical protein AABZ16_05460 [candidate division NC10 bacterium]|jgi:hypothetical protein